MGHMGKFESLMGSLSYAEMRTDRYFRFLVPVSLDGIGSNILSPRETWADKDAYDMQAIKLVGMFRENFKKFKAYVGKDVRDAAPQYTGTLM
jgi:phosphoenolpyruvate carboxykinase (ATP)